jgi:hypothetical protein
MQFLHSGIVFSSLIPSGLRAGQTFQVSVSEPAGITHRIENAIENATRVFCSICAAHGGVALPDHCREFFQRTNASIVLAVYGDHNFTDVLVKHKISFDKWPELTNQETDNASQDNESWVQHASRLWLSDQHHAGTEDTNIGVISENRKHILVLRGTEETYTVLLTSIPIYSKSQGLGAVSQHQCTHEIQVACTSPSASPHASRCSPAGSVQLHNRSLAGFGAFVSCNYPC